MTVYNVNIGIGWASSGVEYAQAYRAKMLRQINQPAKFIFTEMILHEYIESFTKNIGFKDDEVIWMYQYFTDIKIAPNSYPVSKVEEEINLKNREHKVEKQPKLIRYIFPETNDMVTCYLKSEEKPYVERVEYVSNGCLIKKDYFSYTKYMTEYYGPKDNQAHVYLRRFFNEDGTVGLEQYVDGKTGEIYRRGKELFFSRAEFIAYFLKQLHMTEDDILILDRSTDGGTTFFKNVKPAKLGIVVHADHFAANATDDDNILWNNFYEYQFDNQDKVDFFIVATDPQNKLLAEHFKHYFDATPRIFTIPVGSLKKLKHPTKSRPRKQFSLVTASRLAGEKHLDWVIKAVVKAKKQVPKLSIDIYGEGVERPKLEALIKELDCGKYVTLKGHRDLSNVYQHYSAYVAGSTSEGFGLSLLEAVGGGLPMVGYDVRYGNQTFIDDGKNGHLLPYSTTQAIGRNVDLLASAIVKLFTQDDLDKMSERSYAIAQNYLTEEVEKKWQKLIGEMTNA